MAGLVNNNKYKAMIINPTVALTLFLLVINFISAFTWGFGPTTFIGLLLLVGIVAKQTRIFLISHTQLLAPGLTITQQL